MIELKNSHSPLIKKGWIRSLVFLLIYISLFQLAVPLILDITGTYQWAADFNLLMNILIMVVISLLALVVCMKFIDRKPITALGFSTHTMRENASIGNLLAIILLGTGSLILFLNKNIVWTDIRPAENLLLYLLILALVAFSEEIIFRGYILSNLMSSFNKWVALSLSALIFALFHMNNPGMNWVSMLNLFAGGLLMGLNYIYTRNLWFAIFFHFTWNYIQGPVLGFKVSGLDFDSLLVQQLKGNELLSGGAFGFEGSIIQTVLFIVTIMLLVIYYENRFSLQVHSEIHIESGK